jgi:hypothetical protein
VAGRADRGASGHPPHATSVNATTAPAAPHACSSAVLPLLGGDLTRRTVRVYLIVVVVLFVLTRSAPTNTLSVIVCVPLLVFLAVFRLNWNVSVLAL